MFRAVCLTLALTVAAPASAADKHSHGQPYAGQQGRAISTLSAADIAAVEAGKGWGLAKPAELNGYPGPAHLLEMAEEVELTEEQIIEIEGVFKVMREEAVAAGRAWLDAEREIDRLFREGVADADSLDAALRVAAERRMALRRVHLNAHLKVAPLLSEHQRETYAMLRGYGGGHGGHKGHGSHQQ